MFAWVKPGPAILTFDDALPRTMLALSEETRLPVQSANRISVWLGAMRKLLSIQGLEDKLSSLELSEKSSPGQR